MKNQQIYTYFKCKLYLVKGFKANILIKNNVFASKSFILNHKMRHTVVESCKVTIPIKAR